MAPWKKNPKLQIEIPCSCWYNIDTASRCVVSNIIYVESRFMFLALFFFSFFSPFSATIAALFNFYLITQKLDMETITCSPYQAAKLWMLQDTEHIPLVQISLAIIWWSELSLGARNTGSSPAGKACLCFLYECIHVRERERQTAKQGWMGWQGESKSMQECANTKHVYSKPVTLKISRWGWQQQGSQTASVR